jgi:hypothetical protein
MPQKYRFKQRPYKHQVLAVKKLLATGWGGALLMEPRTGKTKVAIDYMSILHQAGHVNRVLVVGPTVAAGVWSQQLEANCPLPYSFLHWNRKIRKTTRRRAVAGLNGRKQRVTVRNTQYQALPPFGRDRLDVVFLNYDAFAAPGAIRKKTDEEIIRSRSRGGRFDMKKAIIAWQPQLIILDESHRIKTPSAKKSTMIHSLQKIPDYRVIMTGTVVTKSKRLFDVYSQWKFLNPERFGGMTFAQFKTRYGKWEAREKYSVWKGNQNEDELHALIHQDAFSITREECYDLPPVTSQIIPVELEESAELYDQMAEDMVARIYTGEITEASIRLVQTLRLQQITSGISKTSPSIEFPRGRLVVIGSEKLRAIQNRLEDLMEMDEKVVIGALFKADIARLQALVKKLKVPCFTIQGGMKDADRDKAWQQFPKVKGGAVFIGQPAAAGEAIDLSCASIMQWYSLPSSWVNYTQFSDRVALSGRPVFYEYFLATGTVDYLRKESLDEDTSIGKKMISSPERLLRLRESGL